MLRPCDEKKIKEIVLNHYLKYIKKDFGDYKFCLGVCLRKIECK